jgi:hypothetical protein
MSRQTRPLQEPTIFGNLIKQPNKGTSTSLIWLLFKKKEKLDPDGLLKWRKKNEEWREERRRWAEMKAGELIKAEKGLETDWKRVKDLMGSLERMSVRVS